MGEAICLPVGPINNADAANHGGCFIFSYARKAPQALLIVNRYARARQMKRKQGKALEQVGDPVRRGGQAFAPHLDGDAGNLLVP